jgi:hypothetical protein
VTLVDPETGEVVPTLASCEEVIERGLGTFVEVGNALLTIRDAKLYRADYDTFEGYCIDRWNLSRKRAYDLTNAAEVVAALSPIGDTPLPTNEAQARALAPLKDHPEVAAEAMRRATTNGKATATSVRDAVKAVVHEEIAKAAAKADDREALSKLVADAQRAGFDMDEARTQQRGAFARLCKDIAALPDPAAFIKDHGDYLRVRHGQYAESAHAWLTTFMDLWRAK